MSENTDNEHAFIVGEWLIEPQLNRFTNTQSKQSQVVTPKVMQLCVLLSRAHPNALSQDVIASMVWPDRVISDSSIYQLVAQLRKALNDLTPEKRFVERVSGKGYRFLVKSRSQELVNEPFTSVELSKEERSSEPRSSARKMLALATAVSLVVAGLFGFQYLHNKGGLKEQSHQIQQVLNSIAIAPVQNETQPKIAMLSSFNGALLEGLVKLPRLNIIYLRTNETEVQADALLITRILNDGNTLTVQVSLLNNFNNQVLWSKHLSGVSEELLSLQNRASVSLMQFLGEKSNNPDQLIDPIVYQDYLLANYLWNKRELTSLERAKTLFEKVLLRQPGYAPAMLGLCNTYLFLHIYGDWREDAAKSSCEPLIRNAFELLPDNGAIVATKALLTHDSDTELTESLFNQAIQLSPSYANGYLWFGNFMRQTGRYTEALGLHQKALSLDPLSPIILRSLAYSHLNLRQLHDARYFYQRSLAIEPDYSQRALEALDFLPLDVSKAADFLRWTKIAGQYLVNRPENKLTHALVQLSMGEIQNAVDLYSEVQGEAINPAFHLYVGAAIEAAKGDNLAAQKLLKQRLNLSPEINTFAMPYIVTLLAGQQMQQALETFEQYFPEVAGLRFGERVNFPQSLLYLHLLEKAGAKSRAVKFKAAIRELIAQGESAGVTVNCVECLVMKREYGGAKAMIESMLTAGWLPDINDNIYAHSYMRSIYIDLGGNGLEFDEQVTRNREKVLSELIGFIPAV